MNGSPDAAADVLYDAADGVVTITINRPGRLNALNANARQLLFDAWCRFEADRSARVAILTAAGERSFCVGRDLHEPADGDFVLESFPILGISVEVSKPTIAAVNGYALGGGFLLAQMCDLCVASETATFSIPESKLGRGAAWAAPLAAMLPTRVVMELLVTAAPLSAARMHEVGFVNQVVPAGELRVAAHRMASLVAANAPLSVGACKQMVDRVAREGRPMARADAEGMFRHVYASRDAREGLAAFRERRAPSWSGE